MTTYHQSLIAFLQDPGRSIRSLAKQTGATRSTVRRRRGVLQAALQKAGQNADSGDVVRKLLATYRTWGDRVRPNFDAIEAALARGESLRSTWRTYSKENGKRALKFAQFAALCRRKRGGRSLLCVRRRPPGSIGLLKTARASRPTRGPRSGEACP